MSATFAESAHRLAGATALALGWRPGEFWSATPAELAAIFTHGGDPGPAPLSRNELTTLMERDGHG